VFFLRYSQIGEGHFTDTSRGAFTPQDIRFTTKENNLYALILASPGKTALITSLTPDAFSAEKIKSVTLLGMDGQLKWEQDDSGLQVFLPENIPGKYAWTVKIEKYRSRSTG